MADTKRLLITLSGSANEALDNIKDDLGESSKAEVIRNALSLYFTVFKKAKSGYELCLVRGDEIRVIDSPGLLPTLDWPGKIKDEIPVVKELVTAPVKEQPV